MKYGQNIVAFPRAPNTKTKKVGTVLFLGGFLYLLSFGIWSPTARFCLIPGQKAWFCLKKILFVFEARAVFGPLRIFCLFFLRLLFGKCQTGHWCLGIPRVALEEPWSERVLSMALAWDPKRCVVLGGVWLNFFQSWKKMSHSQRLGHQKTVFCSFLVFFVFVSSVSRGVALAF